MEKSLLNSPKAWGIIVQILDTPGWLRAGFGGNKSREIENCTKIQFWMEIFSFMCAGSELVLDWTIFEVQSFLWRFEYRFAMMQI